MRLGVVLCIYLRPILLVLSGTGETTGRTVGALIGVTVYSIGIPRDSVLQYETAIQSDKYLVIAYGTADDVTKAKEILDPLDKVEVAVHHA